MDAATVDHIHATPIDEPSVTRGWQQCVSVKVEKAFHSEALWPFLDSHERVLVLSQTRHAFARCFFDDFDCHCSSIPALADAAVSSTAMATIGLWSGDVSQWKWLWHASAEREGPGFNESSWSMTSICRRFQALMADVWKSSRKGCLSFSGGAQLALDTTLVSVSWGDGIARVGAHTPGEAFKVARRRGRRGRTLSRRVPDSLSSLVRSEDGSLLKQRVSSHRWLSTK